MIQPGAEAPDFVADSTGGRLALADLVETGPVVLFFYFKADTPG